MLFICTFYLHLISFSNHLQSALLPAFTHPSIPTAINRRTFLAPVTKEPMPSKHSVDVGLGWARLFAVCLPCPESRPTPVLIIASQSYLSRAFHFGCAELTAESHAQWQGNAYICFGSGSWGETCVFLPFLVREYFLCRNRVIFFFVEDFLPVTRSVKHHLLLLLGRRVPPIPKPRYLLHSGVLWVKLLPPHVPPGGTCMPLYELPGQNHKFRWDNKQFLKSSN